MGHGVPFWRALSQTRTELRSAQGTRGADLRIAPLLRRVRAVVLSAGVNTNAMMR
jgi:hypothetical protein